MLCVLCVFWGEGGAGVSYPVLLPLVAIHPFHMEGEVWCVN